jgi:alpha-L-fucosidase
MMAFACGKPMWAIFNIENRDLVAEWCAALRMRGIRVGLYYSLLDWRFGAYFAGRDTDPLGFEEMVSQCHHQVKELMTRYGEIDVLWYDGNWLPAINDGIIVRHDVPAPEVWRAQELNAMVRHYQPNILINNRSGTPEDLDTPEQHVTASASGRGWEACMTIGDARGWGYLANNPTRKSSVQLLEFLATAAAGEGNFLLNIGPDRTGKVPGEDQSVLQEIGSWLKVNGAAIHGSNRCPFGSGLGGPLLGPFTARKNQAYAIVVRWPGGEVTIPGIANEVQSVRILGQDSSLSFHMESNRRLVIETPYEAPPSPLPTVFEIVLDGSPRGAPFSIPL